MADIEYKTPQDVADDKMRAAAGKAYDKALTEPWIDSRDRFYQGCHTAESPARFAFRA